MNYWSNFKKWFFYGYLWILPSQESSNFADHFLLSCLPFFFWLSVMWHHYVHIMPFNMKRTLILFLFVFISYSYPRPWSSPNSVKKYFCLYICHFLLLWTFIQKKTTQRFPNSQQSKENIVIFKMKIKLFCGSIPDEKGVYIIHMYFDLIYFIQQNSQKCVFFLE